ncbi:alpha-(1-_3)-arabinofuranosyltransferase [Actinomadura macrotermitis]|uniref:Alpha-(1->3)-arabinofuranosyltransferase n=1 Tax=Actinomadura macrotermitis TaxID=2585200 RepID=A0A7K0C0Q3_9ACTN|nr:alpha-(1->3)-arabinofuranosyltransferase [Actinomadura macrotermitis]MQY07041.1 Alpha-(1->3)-arabinofuranosyltransferase [Actinomadura macrotermitis]
MKDEHAPARPQWWRGEGAAVAACCLALTVLAFVTAPGRILSDTKLDMPVNPGGFLARAVHLWDPSAHFGQLQNQAYGYLFPMGPFYWLGHAVGLPAWITQRLWLSLVLCAAFAGLARLARAMGVGGPRSRLLGALVYALAPRAQELVGINSSEFLPAAVLPWIMLPLVRGANEGSPRRAAALSALAAVACGGINGGAELSVLVVPLLYLLTRPGGPRKRRLLAWWLPCMGAAVFWWFVPLLFMGSLTFPFIDYVENAATTTGTTSLLEILRGTSNWVGHLTVNGASWWPAGHALSTAAWLVAVTALVAGLGAAGLCLPGLRERRFLLISLLAGVAIVSTGHAGQLENPLAGGMRTLLDSTLVAFRNIHKFDALVRLPLAFGMAHLVTVWARRGPAAARRPGRLAIALPLLAVAAVALSVLPAVRPGFAAQGTFTALPAHWRQAAAWLDRNAGDNTTLVVPGARFGEYQWGRSMDEPLQPLLASKWAARQVVPGGSAGLARLMEAIDDRFATGRGSAGLATVLARMGVRYLLVRNDLDRAAAEGAWPARVHEALQDMPGVRRVAEFGGHAGFPLNADATTAIDQPYRQVEIYEVPDVGAGVSLLSERRPLRVFGGPESMIDLADQGLLDARRPVFFNDDPAPSRDAEVVVTDSLRRRDVNFSDLRGGASPTFAEGDRPSSRSKVKDYLDPAWQPYASTARITGLASVTASSAASDAVALPGGTAADLPFAAVDGDPGTQWKSAGLRGPVGEWLRLGFARPLDPGRLRVTFGNGALLGPPVTEVAVETAAGTLRQNVQPTGAPQTLRVPPGRTDWLRLRVTGVAGGAGDGMGNQVAISELSVPGMPAAGRTIVASPGRRDAGPATVLLSGQSGTTAPCMRGSRTWACSPYLAARGEDRSDFDRTFTLPAAENVRLSGTAVLTDQATVDRYTSFGKVRTAGSAPYVQHPAVSARSAFDGDPATTWLSAAGDTAPWLSIDFGRTVRLSKLTFRYPQETGPAPNLQVTVSGADGDRSGVVGPDGVFRFAPMTTGRLTIRFAVQRGPVQITDIAVPGVRPLGPPPALRIRTMCGAGPSVVLGDGRRVLTRLSGGTVADLLRGAPVPYEACRTVPLPAGAQRVRVGRDDPFRITSMMLRPRGLRPAQVPGAGDLAATRWTPEQRTVRVDTGAAALLTVNENLNPGWHATAGGAELRALRVDGWRQAWIVPAGTQGTVELRYTPDRWYRLVLVAGLLLIVVLVLLAASPGSGAVRDGGPGRGAPAWTRWLLPLFAGFWVAGPAGLLVIGGVCGVAYYRARRQDQDPYRPPARPVWAVLPAVAAAFSSIAASTVLSGQGTLTDLLADAVPQACCLLLLARLSWELVKPEPRVAGGGPVRFADLEADEIRLRFQSPTRPAGH